LSSPVPAISPILPTLLLSEEFHRILSAQPAANATGFPFLPQHQIPTKHNWTGKIWDEQDRFYLDERDRVEFW
jgi:hypothetical protein